MKILLLMIINISLWANIGTVMAMKGSADLKRETKLMKVSSGMELLKGDAIITHAKSRVQVMLNDDTVVTIGQNSSFGFEDFVFDGTKKSKIAMRATRGFFRSVTGKLGKIAPERFKVKTASATIGIRGTDFSGNIIGDAQTFVCYSGAISVAFDGAINTIDAGMVMQIIKNKVEIKKIELAPSKKVKKVEKKVTKKVKESVKKAVEKVSPKVVEAVEKASPKVAEAIEKASPAVVEALESSIETVESVVDIEDVEQVMPQEVISQITQVIDDRIGEDLVIDDNIINDTPNDVANDTTEEPFEVIPNSENRETQY